MICASPKCLPLHTTAVMKKIDIFHRDVAKAKQQCEMHDIVLVWGDLNAKVGRGRFGEIVGPYGGARGMKNVISGWSGAWRWRENWSY